MKNKIYTILSTISLLMAGCNADGSSEYKIGSDAFKIPDKFVEKSKIPWLPIPSNTIILSIPYDDSGNTINLSIETREGVCKKRSSNQSSMKEFACTKRNSFEDILSIHSLHKRSDGIYSNYLAYIDNVQMKISSCSPLKDGSGLCTSIFSYRDEIVTIYYNERSIDAIDAIRTTVSHLSIWDTHNHDAR